MDPWCGGLVAAELLKKKEEETEGSEDIESVEGLAASEGLDSGDEANGETWETEVDCSASFERLLWRTRMVDALVLGLHSMVVTERELGSS